MNVGSKWLRNVNDGSNAWSHKSYKSESSNSGQGDGDERYAAKFMDVDGVVRKISGDNDVVSVKAREIRKVDAGIQIQDQLETILGDNVGGKEFAVLDSKRKRVDENLKGVNIGDYDNDSVMDKQELGSKNGQKVGSGLQAHQTQ